MKGTWHILLAASCFLLFGACESMQWRGTESGPTQPWASPEGFENSGAGTPLGMMGGMQRR